MEHYGWLYAMLVITINIDIHGVNYRIKPLQWRHNEHDGVSNHQPHDCLLKHLFRRR